MRNNRVVQVNWENAGEYGDLLASSYKLRKKVFVDRMGWDVPCSREMEYDSYDTPHAEYLLVPDDEGRVVAMARMIPTVMPYMIEELWPERIHPDALLKDKEAWEVTRVCIDQNIPRKDFRQAVSLLVTSIAEFIVLNEGRIGIGYTSERTWRLLNRFGHKTKRAGDMYKGLHGFEYAGIGYFDEAVVKSCREKGSFSEPVLIPVFGTSIRQAA